MLCIARPMYVACMATQPTKPDKIRVPLDLTSEEVRELDDWQFGHRYRTRKAAILAALRLAYEAQPVAPAPKAPSMPKSRKKAESGAE